MGKEKLVFKNDVSIKNKRASFEYHFLDKYVAGIVLQGSEMKSLRLGKANLQDAYCVILGDEIFVKEMHISPYKSATQYFHEPKGDRKLLLNKKEIKKLLNKQEKGLTIIPIRIFINERGMAKLEIALAKGKKIYDKREDIKEKDLKRDMARLKL